MLVATIGFGYPTSMYRVPLLGPQMGWFIILVISFQFSTGMTSAVWKRTSLSFRMGFMALTAFVAGLSFTLPDPPLGAGSGSVPAAALAPWMFNPA